MTETNYKAAFEEINLLNRLFEKQRSVVGPKLDPEAFAYVEGEATDDEVIIMGLQSGVYFRSYRIEKNRSGGGYPLFSYTAFQPVKPEEHTVIKWVKA